MLIKKVRKLVFVVLVYWNGLIQRYCLFEIGHLLLIFRWDDWTIRSPVFLLLNYATKFSDMRRNVLDNGSVPFLITLTVGTTGLSVSGSKEGEQNILLPRVLRRVCLWKCLGVGSIPHPSQTPHRNEVSKVVHYKIVLKYHRERSIESNLRPPFIVYTGSPLKSYRS